MLSWIVHPAQHADCLDRQHLFDLLVDRDWMGNQMYVETRGQGEVGPTKPSFWCSLMAWEEAQPLFEPVVAYTD